MTEYFTVENEEGDRIDRYLAEEMPERSRSFLQKLIKKDYKSPNIYTKLIFWFFSTYKVLVVHWNNI